MPTLFGAATTPADVLSAARRQVSRAAGLPIDRVFGSLATDAAHLAFPPADVFVTLRPAGMRPSVGIVTGAGRNHYPVDARLRVALFHRYAADQELRQTRLLEDTNAGVLALWVKLVSALEQYAPLDAAAEGVTQSILREPMRQGAEGFDLTPHDVKTGPWVVVSGFFEVKFVLDIPAAVP